MYASATRRFCSTACRKRAFRRRAAGLAESAFPDGAGRGEIEAAAREVERLAAAALLRDALAVARGPSVYERRGIQTVGGEP